jgi:alpha-galactosidase
MKIVLIGAGSQSFGRGQVVDVLSSADLRGRKTVLSLVDVNPDALATMLAFAERVKAHTGTDVALQTERERTKALPGASYVITSVARRRSELWEQDYRVPRAYGFEHCYGENGGPGALFHALRSFELVLPICRDVETLCPRALLLNFTNPEARVLQAICDLTRVRAAGICHGVFAAIQAISHYLQRPVDQFEAVSAGINHFYAVLKVVDRKTGEDMQPELLRRVFTMPPPAFKWVHDLDLFKKLVEVFGVFSYPSDTHLGEYLPWGSGYCGARWFRGGEFRAVPPVPPPESPSLADYATGRLPLDDRILRPSGEITVPIICDMELDRGARRDAVNVLNGGGYISNLPADSVVEVPASVDAAGIHPETVGPLPEAFAALARHQLAINKLTVEAYRTRSRRLLLQVLLLEPTVNSAPRAEAMLDEMLALQKDYLPSFE